MTTSTKHKSIDVKDRWMMGRHLIAETSARIKLIMTVYSCNVQPVEYKSGDRLYKNVIQGVT